MTSRAAAERLDAIGRLAAGVAHDLNNSLAPVVGFSELLLNDASGSGLSARQREWLELIHRGALDAAGTVTRLREAYRTRAAPDEYEPVDVRRLFQLVVALTRPEWQDAATAAGKSIAVRTERTESRTAALVLGDAGELREALSNLVRNAADAIPESGTITLRAHTADGRDGASRVVLEEQPSTRAAGGASARGVRGRWVVLEVSDTGVGMSETERERCLEPFFTTKGVRGGGLGLSLVHGTVQRHGGRMEIDSRPHAGTTVRLILPAAELAH